METKELVVGTYRRVKTWDQLLATEGAKLDVADIEFTNLTFIDSMKHLCSTVIEIDEGYGCFCTSDQRFQLIPEFFTDETFDENGNEIDFSKLKGGDTLPDGRIFISTVEWVDDIDPLDQLESEATQTLATISKVREIELKQAKIDVLIAEQTKRVNELKGEVK